MCMRAAEVRGRPQHKKILQQQLHSKANLLPFSRTTKNTPQNHMLLCDA